MLGKSNYLFRNQVFELEAFEESAETFITQSIGLAADELSAYYAILLSGTDSGMEVNLTVEGIGSAEDYAGLDPLRKDGANAWITLVTPIAFQWASWSIT